MSCFLPKAAQAKTSSTPAPSAPVANTERIPSPDEVHLTDYASGLGCACKIRFCTIFL